VTSDRPTGHRLNARLDRALARKLAFLCRLTGKSVTAVVKAAIAAYYDRLRGGSSAAEVLERTGFVGCAAGRRDLSTRYKAALSDSLAKKT
jgi:hypothetical protein